MGRKAAETCTVVIPIKLEFSASVGFIRKESVTMHGHMIVKYIELLFCFRRNVAWLESKHVDVIVFNYEKCCVDGYYLLITYNRRSWIKVFSAKAYENID